MKKLILSTCFALLSVGAFASSSTNSKGVIETRAMSSKFEMVAQIRVTGSYTSKCVASWSLVAYGSTQALAVLGILDLQNACDAACGTNTTQIVIPSY